MQQAEVLRLRKLSSILNLLLARVAESLYSKYCDWDSAGGGQNRGKGGV